MTSLTADDLKRPDLELAERLRELAPNAPDDWSALGSLFELDDEVRNGGFAQYFFNPSCVGVLDAWLFAREAAPLAAELLALAVLRLGATAGQTIDLEARLAAVGPGGLFPALEALMAIHRQAHEAAGDVRAAFARFRDASAQAAGPLRGFDALNERFWLEVDIDAAAVAHVRANAAEFVQQR